MSSSKKILVVDDEQSICDVISLALKSDGYSVKTTTDPNQAIKIFKEENFDITIQDIKMPGINGIELLKRLKELDKESIFIIMTAYSTWDNAVEAMRLGAFDYIKKPFDTNLDLRATIDRAFKVKEIGKTLKLGLDDALKEMGLIVGESKNIKAVYDLIRRAAPTDSTVLIQGESGTGKELVARALHFCSHRANKPFIAVNCSAFTETLLESELFGHTKGAFTGAVSEKTGLVEVASDGTFFLDEISEMSPQLQVKILRLLEEKEFKPVGNVQNKKVDVRFIAATNRDLDAMVKQGTFRKDLYYRLKVIPIVLPTLKERKGDIPLLAGYFMAKFARQMGKNAKRFSDGAKGAMMNYDWPGNVRELENAIQRAVALSESEDVSRIDIFDPVTAKLTYTDISKRQLTEEGIDLDKELTEIEKDYLKQALTLGKGNHTKSAKLLNMSLSSFRYKIKRYGLDK